MWCHPAKICQVNGWAVGVVKLQDASVECMVRSPLHPNANRAQGPGDGIVSWAGGHNSHPATAGLSMAILSLTRV